MGNLITSVPSITTTEYDVYIKPFLDDPKINALPMTFTFGNMPREIFFNNNLDKIMGAGGSCGWTTKGDAVSFTKKTLNPIEVKAPVEQCYSVLLKKLFGDKLPDGARRGELSPEVIDFMTNQKNYAFNRDLLTLLFLGDTSVTPDDYYSLMDGIYTKLKAGSLVAEADGTLVVDAGTLDATSTNTTNFFTTMKAVYDAQPRALKSLAKERKNWIWTEKLYDQYLAYLYVSTQTNAGIIQREGIEGGISPTSFLGINIVVVSIVDERLETDFLPGSLLAPTNPYLAILTTPENHHVIMDGTAFEVSHMFIQQPEDKVWLTGSALIDYQYGYGELNVIAGF